MTSKIVQFFFSVVGNNAPQKEKLTLGGLHNTTCNNNVSDILTSTVVCPLGTIFPPHTEAIFLSLSNTQIMNRVID